MPLTQELLEAIRASLHIPKEYPLDMTPLTDGRSGADVYRFEVWNSSNPELCGHYIAKILPAGERRNDEQQRAKRLFTFVPTNFHQHLVSVHDADTVGERSLILYRQANDSVRSQAFSGLDVAEKIECARSVSRALLSEMNRISAPTRVPIGQALGEMMSKQLSASGRFWNRAYALLKESNRSRFCWDERKPSLPNPAYAFARLNDINKEAALWKGASHGDLHGGNILVHDSEYALIDYDSSSTDAWLFFDNAYLEFSCLYDKIQDGTTLEQWMKMLDALLETDFSKTVENPFAAFNLENLHIRNAVCGGIADWMNGAHFEGMRDSIQTQFTMGRIAAGVNFFSKRGCSDGLKQKLVFCYIAYCLNQLLEQIHFQFPLTGITFLSDGEPSAPENQPSVTETAPPTPENQPSETNQWNAPMRDYKTALEDFQRAANKEPLLKGVAAIGQEVWNRLTSQDKDAPAFLRQYILEMTALLSRPKSIRDESRLAAEGLLAKAKSLQDSLSNNPAY